VHGWIYGIEDGLLRDLGLKLSSLADAENLDRINSYAGLAEPVTMIRRHAVEAFEGLSMLVPQLLEEG
jgi:carbonic anhydrase